MLKSFTSINPLLVASFNRLVLKRLLNLPTLVLHVLNDVEEQEFKKEVTDLLLSSNLTPVLAGSNNDDDGGQVDCLSWRFMVKSKYPFVFKRSLQFSPSSMAQTWSPHLTSWEMWLANWNLQFLSGYQIYPKARQPPFENRYVKKFRKDDWFFTPINRTLANSNNTVATDANTTIAPDKSEQGGAHSGDTCFSTDIATNANNDVVMVTSSRKLQVEKLSSYFFQGTIDLNCVLVFFLMKKISYIFDTLAEGHFYLS